MNYKFTIDHDFSEPVDKRGSVKIYSTLLTHLLPGWGQKAKKKFFESGPVAYQFKGNGAQSTKQACILCLHMWS